MASPLNRLSSGKTEFIDDVRSDPGSKSRSPPRLSSVRIICGVSGEHHRTRAKREPVEAKERRVRRCAMVPVGRETLKRMEGM